MVICLERCVDLHMAQLMPLPLTVSCSNKIQIGFTFWYRLTWVVPDKGPLNGCVCVCVNVDMKAQKARKISCKNSQPLENFFRRPQGVAILDSH